MSSPAVMTVPTTAYQAQQALVRKQADRIAELEKGLPTTNTEQEEQNRALRARTFALEQELERLRAAKESGKKELPPLIISEKGAIGVLLKDKGFRYVWFYPGQLHKIFAMDTDIRGFLAEHDAELK